MSSKILAIAVAAVLSDVVDVGEAMSVLQTSGGQRVAVVDREAATAHEAENSFTMNSERVKGLQELLRQLKAMRVDGKHAELERLAEEILNEDITHQQAHQSELMKLVNHKSIDETSARFKEYMVDLVAADSGENEDDAIEAITEVLPGDVVYPAGDQLPNGESTTEDEAVHSFMLYNARVKGLQEIKRRLKAMRLKSKHVELEQIAEEILNEDIMHEQAHQVALMKLANRKSTDETSARATGYMVEWVASENGENEEAIEATTATLARVLQHGAEESGVSLEATLSPGEAVVYTGDDRDLATGARVEHGEVGTVLSVDAALQTIRVQFSVSLPWPNGTIRVRSPGNGTVADVSSNDLSKFSEEEEIQFEQGADVVYKGATQHWPSGDRLLPGLTGRIVGDLNGAGHRVRVKFDGNRQVVAVLRSSVVVQTDEEDYVKLGRGLCRDADDKPLSYYLADDVSETQCRAKCDSDVLCAGYAFGSGDCAIYSWYSTPEGWKHLAEGLRPSLTQKDSVDATGYVCMKKMKQAVEWKLGEAGQSCEEACDGQCVDNAWPQAEQEFVGIANYSQLQCSEVDKGNFDHNPSMCHGRCYWQFAPTSQATNRCSSAMSGCARLCPCQTEVSEIRAEPDLDPYRSLGEGFCRDQRAMRPSYYFAHDLTDDQCEQQCDSDRQCTGYTFGGPDFFCAVYSERTEGFPSNFQFHRGEEGSAAVQQPRFSPDHICMLKTNLESPIYWNMHQVVEDNLALQQEARRQVVEHLSHRMDQFVFMSEREADLNRTAAASSTQAQAGFKVVGESKEEIKAQPVAAYETLGGLVLEDAGSVAERLLENFETVHNV